MIGSETFIIVALRWTENSTPSALARAICGVEELVQRGHVQRGGVDDLAGQHRHRLACSTVVVPSSATSSIRSEPARSITADFSLERKSSAVMCATLVLESGDQAPIECGWLARVLLDRRRRPAVGVALAQHRVDRTALDLVVAGADVLLLVGGAGLSG